MDEFADDFEHEKSSPPEAEENHIESLARRFQTISTDIRKTLEMAKAAHSDGDNAKARELKSVAKEYFDQQAVLREEIATLLFPHLYVIALGRVHNETRASDVAAEALEKIIVRLDAFKWNSKFSTWCYAFVGYRWLDLWRKITRYEKRKQRLQELSEIDPQLTEPFTGKVIDTPDAIAASNSELEAILAKLQLLPPDCFRRLVMVALEYLSQQEVAGQLGEAVSYTKDRIRYCRELAQKQLSRMDV